PYQPWALEQRKENFSKYIDPNVPCFSSGVPRMLYTPGDITIAQTKDAFVITHSRSHTFRVIPLGPAPRVDTSVRLALGTSREPNRRVYPGRRSERNDAERMAARVRDDEGVLRLSDRDVARRIQHSRHARRKARHVGIDVLGEVLLALLERPRLIR